MNVFRNSILVSVAALIAAFVYGATGDIAFSVLAGFATAGLTAILGLLEVALSFDNAIVNARILKNLSERWQYLFLTVGWFIAVVGMRFVVPVAVVCFVSGLNPVDALTLALAKGDPATPGTYGYILTSAHPLIAGFGGMFLLNLALDYFIDGEKDVHWLWPIERFLVKIDGVNKASELISLGVLLYVAFGLAEDPLQVLVSGVLGLCIYIAVNGLGNYFEQDEDGNEPSGPSALVKLTGRAAFMSFIYLEMIDATFSFDGVIGAFAITPDIILITLGLGFIGAMFVRSLTVYLVREGTLDEYVYLEPGAHWAIGALAILLLASIGVEIPEIVTGLSGVVIIGAAFLSSISHNRHQLAAAAATPTTPTAAPARAENL